MEVVEELDEVVEAEEMQIQNQDLQLVQEEGKVEVEAVERIEKGKT